MRSLNLAYQKHRKKSMTPVTGNDMSWTEKTIYKRMGVCVLGIRERTRPFFNISYFLV